MKLKLPHQALLILIFAGAFILRFILIPSAYHGDLNNNISWGNEAVKNGLSGFYERESWNFSAPNQPPLYILLFATTSFIYQTILDFSWNINSKLAMFPSSFIWFWEAKGMIYLVKLPSILADLGIGLVIYKFFKQRKNEKLALGLSTLWLFNPITWYNSAVWGQTDALVNLFGLVSILSVLNGKLEKGIIFFVISILFKGSLALFAPLLLVISLCKKYKFVTLVKAAVCGFIVFVGSAMWFHINIDLPIWMINLYLNKFFPGEIGYLTANAFNFWWLVDSGKTLDNGVYFGLTARVWGLTAVTVSIVSLGIWISKKFDEKRVLLSFSILSLVTFLFMTRIHERYLYPFFPLATLLVGLIPGFWIVYFVFSITHLANLYHLFWIPTSVVLEGLYVEPLFACVIAVINIAAFIFVLRHLRSGRI
ncbi:MAG: hypothetical protein AAB546_02780 [Patescibacteria group bacterium]